MVAGCVLVRSFLERAACYSSTISDRVFFFFPPPNQKSRVKAALTAETDIRVFIAERIIYHGRPLDLHWIVLRIIRACHC